MNTKHYHDWFCKDQISSTLYFSEFVKVINRYMLDKLEPSGNKVTIIFLL